MLMKKQFLKSVLLVSAALALVNCDDKAADAISNLTPDANIPASSASGSAPVDPSEACWLMEANGAQYLVYPTGIITDINGQTIAQVTLTQDATGAFTGTATSFDGTPIFEINTADLKVVTLEQLNPTAKSSAATTLPPASSATVPALSSATVPTLSSNSQQPLPGASSSSTKTVATSSSSNPQQQAQSSAATSSNCDGKCFDSASGKCVEYHTTLKGSNEEQYAYNESCKLNCYYDPTGKNCQNMTGAAPASSAAQQPKSSSSVKSSSSQQQQQQQSSSSVRSSSSARSSSSVQSSSSQQQQQQGGSLLPKVVSGAQTKSGYATRYWDSCKPHCAWEGKGGPVARTCQADGVTKAGSGESSVCDGGNAGTCFDQTPQIVNDTIAYAFAATPGGGNDCGKCYMLTFKGTGASATSTPTNDHHRKIKGKHLIVMSSNIGYDVSHNQFDLMIPGGGPGAFNGCGKMGISCAGAQYGGFLTTCNYKKDCLIDMCNKEYGNNTSLKNGCLFLANWMDAANNPEVDFVEVECPQALKDKY